MTIKVIVFEILLRLKQFKPEFFFMDIILNFLPFPLKKENLENLSVQDLKN